MINPILFGAGYARTSGIAASHASADAARASSSARDNQRDLDHLEDRLDRLSLICMAMWSLLQDKSNLTEEDLLKRVKIIDLIDGTDDGKATKSVSKCPKCNRTMSPRHRKCLYCGSGKLISSAFDTL
jgi:hypothetical protein